MSEAVGSGVQVLGPGAGWGVVFGLGVGFAFVMLAISWMQARYGGVDLSKTDEFISASRSVNRGLVCTSTVSAWVWAATLLQSSTVAYEYGISGPFWYAAGATIQILLFAMLAAKIKSNAPYATTFLQIIKTRWGTGAHLSFMFFALATNALVSAQLLLGGSAVVHALTGIPTIAAIFLIPISVACFAVVGGQRSVFMADWLHTTALCIILLVFAFKVHATSPLIGSPRKLYDMLAMQPPVVGNAGGSYTTFRSIPGLQFGVINIIGNLAAVFADQGYFNRAISAKPEAAVPAYLLAGAAWCAIPLTMASSLGLAARAMVGQVPSMVNLTEDQVRAGLSAPAAAVALMGPAGAAIILVLLFLAVTSSTSAELLAVASLAPFDIWKAYVRPKATEKELSVVSHAFIVGWAIVMAALALMFYEIKISLGWLYLAFGIVICPATIPIYTALTWPKANRAAALTSMWSGLIAGMAVWFGTAYAMYGSVTVETTGKNEPVLAGNIVSLLFPALIMVPWSFLRPESYDWGTTRAIRSPNDIDQALEKVSGAEESGTASVDGGNTASLDDGDEKSSPTAPPAFGEKSGNTAVPVVSALSKQTSAVHDYESPSKGTEHYLIAAGLDPAQLDAAFRLARNTACVLTVVLVIFVPCMMVIPVNWSQTGFTAWIGIITGWMIISACICIGLPVYEGIPAVLDTIKSIARDLKRK